MRSILFLCAALFAAPSYGLDVPSIVKQYEPVVIKHESGTEVQILPWGTPIPAFVDESFVKRFDGLTVFGGPPGSYLVSGDGKLAIVVIQQDSPLPIPPGPGPPNPGPTPPPRSCENVPADKFNNVGKLACSSLSLVSAEARSKYQAAVRAAYLETATAVRNPSASQVLSLNDAQEYLRTKLSNALSSDKLAFAEWGNRVNAHVAALSITRNDYDDLCEAIAKGLE